MGIRLVVELYSQPCMLDQIGVTVSDNAVGYYDKEIITFVKHFRAPRAYPINF